MRGRAGQIKVEDDEISGDGANYHSAAIEIRDGIITRITWPARHPEYDKHDSSFGEAGAFIGYQSRHPAPSTWDFTLTSNPAIVTDGSTYTLDLNHIIPNNAHAIMLSVEVTDNAAGSEIKFRHHDHVNYIGGLNCYTLIANQTAAYDGVVNTGHHEKISYTASNVTFTSVNIVIKGWWIL